MQDRAMQTMISHDHYNDSNINCTIHTQLLPSLFHNQLHTIYRSTSTIPVFFNRRIPLQSFWRSRSAVEHLRLLSP